MPIDGVAARVGLGSATLHASNKLIAVNDASIE